MYCCYRESKTRLSKQQTSTSNDRIRARSSGGTPHVCQQLRCSNKNSGVAVKTFGTGIIFLILVHFLYKM
jgi:hypothetical protein